MEPVDENKRPKWQTWLKRVGFVGFMFFLIKGLIWIAIFVGAWYAAKKP